MSNFHLLAFAGSVAQNAALAAIPLVTTDPLFTPSSAGYLPTQSWKMWGAYAQIDSGTRAEVQSPLLRIPTYPKLSYIDTAAAPPNLPPFNLFGDNGPTLVKNDPLNMAVSRAGAGAANCYGLLYLGAGLPQKTYGDIRTVYATATVTCVTAAWVAGALTFSEQLPQGKYRIVGMNCFGTNLLAGRFIFADSMNRPGALAQQAVTEYGWDYFRYGNVGTWGSFENTAPPTMEFLSYGACTAQTVHIDIIKV